MVKFLPEILQEVQTHPTRKYLLLGSLREVIVRLSGSKEGKENLTKHFDEILKLLFEHADHAEEGTRSVVSECLGKLALIQPDVVVLQLKERTKSPSSKVRACVVTALKYTIFEKSLPIDKVLKEHIQAFLDLIMDKEIEVRKAILISLNYIAHHKAKIISSLLPKYLGHLYGETKVKPELIVEIVLGPFKHKVDTGLELRQAGYECMYTLLDSCLTKLEIQDYMSTLVSGLTDEIDIQTLCHLILVRLSKKAPTSLVSSLEPLVEPLRLCVSSKAKDEAVLQQVERNNELIRSALRAINAINKVPDIETVPKFQDFMKSTVLAGDLAKIYNEINATQ
jgi:cullin-associated NEDD8-dissociated protein 1